MNDYERNMVVPHVCTLGCTLMPTDHLPAKTMMLAPLPKGVEDTPETRARLQAMVESGTRPVDQFQRFWDNHAAWSNATFGADRGPIGALKHLEKEAREAQANPTDHVEYADCLLLIVDAARRSGLTLTGLLDIAEAKLEKCKLRVWPTPTSDEPVEHVRGIHD